MQQARFPVVKATNFALAAVQPAFENPFPDVTFLTFHFTFETALGPSYGVTRLVWDQDAWRAFTCFTLLEEVKGHPRKIGAFRPRGSHNDAISYDEKRDLEREFADSAPEVLISTCTLFAVCNSPHRVWSLTEQSVVDITVWLPPLNSSRWVSTRSSLILSSESVTTGDCDTALYPSTTRLKPTTSPSFLSLLPGQCTLPPASSPTSSSRTSRS